MSGGHFGPGPIVTHDPALVSRTNESGVYGGHFTSVGGGGLHGASPAGGHGMPCVIAAMHDFPRA